MSRRYSLPHIFGLSWLTLLLAPIAWAAALGILWSLTDEACSKGSRDAMWLTAGVCVLVACAAAPFAWLRRRRLDGSQAAGERYRFMLEAAAGVSLIFALTLLLSMASILLLSPCRT
jgi:hypothetical protein